MRDVLIQRVLNENFLLLKILTIKGIKNFFFLVLLLLLMKRKTRKYFLIIFTFLNVKFIQCVQYWNFPYWIISSSLLCVFLLCCNTNSAVIFWTSSFNGFINFFPFFWTIFFFFLSNKISVVQFFYMKARFFSILNEFFSEILYPAYILYMNF